ncbi:MAG TPA: hypothetical protein VHW24_24465, partial [Bryobacteraceae bacterium]|nr:hypothetical protein [Bryobacteraceae bacterium]
PNRPEEPYSVCYAVSKTPDPLGEFYRYEFRRKLFPDYPRPAIWTDGYYIPTSTGDTVIQKHDCIVHRNKMLKGEAATEQCLIIDEVNFLNNADIDGIAMPPAGAPNIMLADGGTQLKGMSEHDDKYFQDDGIYYWKVFVDWANPQNTHAEGPVKIPVAPYHFLCNGQLSNCVPQPGAETRLDAQGDKLMQRVVYRNLGDHQSIIAAHSVNGSPGNAGGVRCYEFRIGASGAPALYQQSTYAPDEFFRWMPSGAMDRLGDIGYGYSFGGPPHYVGQRFAVRMAGDALGQLTVQETVLVEGKGVQQRGNRWQDYTSAVIDPSDDCTFWYVGDYFKENAPALTTKIGAFRLPGCLQAKVTGSVFYDLNHDGQRGANEPGVGSIAIKYSGEKSGVLQSGADGTFSAAVPADSAYKTGAYTVSVERTGRSVWTATSAPVALALGETTAPKPADLGVACTVSLKGGEAPKYWAGSKGKAALSQHSPDWQNLLNTKLRLNLPADATTAYDQLKKLISKPTAQAELAALALNIAYGSEDGDATVKDPTRNDWISLNDLVARVASLQGSEQDAYAKLLERVNSNSEQVTPSNPQVCGKK